MSESKPTIPPHFSEIVCIGAGFSGICLAIQLKKKYGFTDIQLYDRNATHSGTWEANRYPGLSFNTDIFLSLKYFC